jgi:hypothetical protein
MVEFGASRFFLVNFRSKNQNNKVSHKTILSGFVRLRLTVIFHPTLALIVAWVKSYDQNSTA